jgi:tripartite-type tricarboxylate transporter receptor subunit TctC
VAKAAADGYTLLLTTSVFVCNPSLYQRVGYDPFKDFAPVTLAGLAAPIVSRHPTFPVKTMPELAQHARVATVNYASPGVGTAGHLAAELFKTVARVSLQQVPYKGAGPAMAALLGGEVRLGFTAVPPVVPHVKAGRLTPVAVTSLKRLDILPGVPTVAESYPGFQVDNMYGLLAPRGTPAPVVKKLNADVVAVLKLPEIGRRLEIEAFDVIGNTPEEFARYLKAEYVKWAKVVKETGARVD